MKTKKLLFLFAAFIAGLFLSTNAQNLKNHLYENFSTQEWEDEFKRLNPTYDTPDGTTSTLFTNLANGPYFDKYELYSGAIEVQNIPANGICFDGSTIHLHDNVSVAWRFKSPSAGVSWVTLPEIPNAGRITLHVKSNGTAGKSIKLYKVEIVDGTEVLTELNSWNLSGQGVAKYQTQVDENRNFWVDSRTPITLRLGGTDAFIKLFGFEVEEHLSVPLKYVADSAQVISNANTTNIGTEQGQYPQTAYDDFNNAIASAMTTFNNLASTRNELNTALTSIKNAITAFLDSKNILNNVFKPTLITIKQSERLLTFSETTNISVYNIAGVLLFEKENIKELDVPKSVGNGFFLIKTNSGASKLYLN